MLTRETWVIENSPELLWYIKTSQNFVFSSDDVLDQSKRGVHWLLIRMIKLWGNIVFDSVKRTRRKFFRSCNLCWLTRNVEIIKTSFSRVNKFFVPLYMYIVAKLSTIILFLKSAVVRIMKQVIRLQCTTACRTKGNILGPTIFCITYTSFSNFCASGSFCWRRAALTSPLAIIPFKYPQYYAPSLSDLRIRYPRTKSDVSWGRANVQTVAAMSETHGENLQDQCFLDNSHQHLAHMLVDIRNSASKHIQIC